MRQDERQKRLALYGIGTSVFLILLPIYGVFAPIELRAEAETHNSEVRLDEYQNQDIKTLILEMCKEYKVNCLLAVDLAQWESQFNEKAQNPITTASGVYQWIDSSWDAFCDGDKYNARDNIRCTMETLSKSKGNLSHWWADATIARLLWENHFIECTNFETRICWPIF